MRHFLSLRDYTGEEIKEIIDLSMRMKANYADFQDALKRKSVIMIFEKKSTRTRASFEAGIAKLGGHAVFLDQQASHLSKARTKDEIRAIEGYADFIMARVNTHATLKEMASVCKKAIVINGLCELYHPCQALADYQTIKEEFGKLQGKTLAYVGDGNNVCNSLIIAGSKLGVKVKAGCPEGYEPLNEALEESRKGIEAEVVHSPEEAVKNADVVYTDTWVSMGQEEEKAKRLKDFKEYTVTKEMMEKAGKDAVFMHCLPAYLGLEVTEEVIESAKSRVFPQAENRMHAQNALMIKLLEWNSGEN